MARGGRRRTTWNKAKRNTRAFKIKKVAIKTLKRAVRLQPRIRKGSKRVTNTRYCGRLARSVYVYKVKVI